MKLIKTAPGVMEYRYTSAEGLEVLVRSYKSTRFAIASKCDTLGNLVIASARCSKSDKFSHRKGMELAISRMNGESYTVFPAMSIVFDPTVG